MPIADRLEWVRERWSFEGGPSQYEAEADINGLCFLVEGLLETLELAKEHAEQLRTAHRDCGSSAREYGTALAQAMLSIQRLHTEADARESSLRRAEQQVERNYEAAQDRLDYVLKLVAEKEWEAHTRESVAFCIFCGMTYTHVPTLPVAERTRFGHARDCKMFGDNGYAEKYRQEVDES